MGGEPPAPPPRTFVTQKQTRIEGKRWWQFDPGGICCPLSNQYIEARMEGKEPGFLTDPSAKRVYKTANRLFWEQDILLEKGLDGEHSGLYDREYNVYHISQGDKPSVLAKMNLQGPVEEKYVQDKDANFDKLLGKFNLIKYPYREYLDKHQIAFVREDDGVNCTSFDANRKGGENRPLPRNGR